MALQENLTISIKPVTDTTGALFVGNLEVRRDGSVVVAIVMGMTAGYLPHLSAPTNSTRPM
eukprot:10470547-Ditylum_brightwellii.AAC.1